MILIDIVRLAALALAFPLGNHVNCFQIKGPYNRPVSLSRQDESILPHASAIMPKNHRFEPLRVATNIDNNDPAVPDKMIRQIDLKIQNYEKKQQKYMDKLNRAKAELEKFQETKQRYLEGGQLGEDSGAAPFSETTVRSIVKVR